MQWYKGKVLSGQKIGRTLGYPTVNLDPSIMPQNLQQGVYAARVQHKGAIYKAALFFGPRVVLSETKNVLEIFLLNFDKEIYGEDLEFQIKDFIRDVKNFSSFKLLSAQLKEDVKTVSRILQ